MSSFRNSSQYEFPELTEFEKDKISDFLDFEHMSMKSPSFPKGQSTTYARRNMTIPPYSNYDPAAMYPAEEEDNQRSRNYGTSVSSSRRSNAKFTKVPIPKGFK